MRTATPDIHGVLQCVKVLYDGKKGLKAKWYDCRDMLTEKGFNLKKMDIVLIGMERITIVKNKLLELNVGISSLRRTNDFVADVLKWLNELIVEMERREIEAEAEADAKSFADNESFGASNVSLGDETDLGLDAEVDLGDGDIGHDTNLLLGLVQGGILTTE